MQTRYKPLFQFFLLFCFGLFSLSCSETPEPNSTTTPISEPKIETLTILTDELRGPILANFSITFEQDYNIHLEIKTVEFDDLLEVFKATATDEATKPDLIIGPHDWLGELATEDLLLPVQLEDAQRANFLPSALAGFTYQRELYGLPYAVENVALFYNTDLVSEPPRTWSDLTVLATALEDSGKVKQAYTLNADAYHYYPLLTAFGGYVFGWDDKGQYDPAKLGLDDTGAIAAAQWLETMVKANHLQPDLDWDAMYEMFEQGESALLITGPWALERIRASGIPYGIAPLPEEIETSLPFVGVQGFMINAHGNNPDLAHTFLQEVVLTEEFMTNFFEANLRPSAYLPTRRQIDDPDLAAFAAIGSNGLPMPAIPEMSAVWDAWEAAIADILAQNQSAEEAFSQAATTIRQTIANQ